MLSELKKTLAERLAKRAEELYGVEARPQAEIPPRRELGDLAFATAMQLARELKKNPRQIAQELAENLDLPDGVSKLEVEGPGFLNLFLDRSRFASELLTAPIVLARERPGKVIVEHTNINPNKAAHIGHLRNAILGDVLARVLRALGVAVEVQNYIDDTGVQLADVVVGFLDLRELSLEEIAAIEDPFDHYCWDLYSEVGRWYQDDADREALRRSTLHELESGSGERAEAGRLIAERIVGRHLGTMRRLGIGYDLLTHESSILGLDFFDRAFEQLKSRGAIRLETEGKNEGCWVMPLAGSEEFEGLEDPDKVIVRSDGTVTYVGKDIAYQLWKFGLLGKDFHYSYWQEQSVWQTVTEPSGSSSAPSFGAAERVVNVIDTRQRYLQKIVRAGLERLGFEAQAERSVHFAYEMVALSAAAAAHLGLEVDGGKGKSLEMSGRKGIGVKADDLIDQLEDKARTEISSRNRDLPAADLTRLSRQIATAALRFFMAKATTNRVIAFDFDEALNFEGESGPYLLYSLVRSRNIRSKLAAAKLADTVDPGEAAALPAEVWNDDLWDLVYATAQIGERVELSGSTLELSILPRTGLELAQKFNAIYHKHPILQEKDSDLRTARLAAVEIFARGLAELADLLGLPVPEKM